MRRKWRLGRKRTQRGEHILFLNLMTLNCLILIFASRYATVYLLQKLKRSDSLYGTLGPIVCTIQLKSLTIRPFCFQKRQEEVSESGRSQVGRGVLPRWNVRRPEAPCSETFHDGTATCCSGDCGVRNGS